jgi:hypothetical protein
MSIIGWNGRGLGQLATVQELVCLVQTYKPCLVFICETRQSEERVKNLRYRIGMKYCFRVKGDGSGGGLALYIIMRTSLLIFSRLVSGTLMCT